MKIKSANITINVRDMDTSVSFYQSIGMDLLNRWGNYYAQLQAPGLVIGLHPLEDNTNKNGSGNVSIGFITDNIDMTKKALLELSIKVTERSEEGGQFLHFNDPDGTSLYFILPKW